jgi:hypothetical protein
VIKIHFDVIRSKGKDLLKNEILKKGISIGEVVEVASS